MSGKTISKTVLITWASWWLWQSLVKEFLWKWYFVVAWVASSDRSLSSFEQNDTLKVLKLDVTNEDDINESVNYIESVWWLDVLINNAAISWWWSFFDKDIKDCKELFNVNLFAPLNLLLHYKNILENKSWVVVNILSIAADVPTPFISAYSASKSALEKLCLWIYLENHKSNIRWLNLKLWPLDRWLCGSSIPSEDSRYKEWVRNHMVKIQRLHGYKVDDVSKYVSWFVDWKVKFMTKTLWLWANIILLFSKFIPQPYYQLLIWKIYRFFK